ncbi:MAG: hypothetical protein J6V80_05485 [Clostridia bacterium]|nr:hypothetical protein [Clostridia bacterium]
MAGAQIGLILLFLFAYIMTRTVWVRIIQENNFRLEFHLPLIAIHLSDFDENKSSKKEENTKLGILSYIRIVSNALRRISKSKLVIKRIILPCNISSFSVSTIIKLYGYHGLIYALIAYLGSRDINLHIEDNAIISSPDIKKTQFYLTVKLALFQLIYALFIVRRDISKEKKAKEEEYVGE